jgi:hypothetical protein
MAGGVSKGGDGDLLLHIREKAREEPGMKIEDVEEAIKLKGKIAGLQQQIEKIHKSKQFVLGGETSTGGFVFSGYKLNGQFNSVVVAMLLEERQKWLDEAMAELGKL